MRLAIAIAAVGDSALAAGAAAAAPAVEIRDAVVRVTVIPEDRADVKVEMLTVNRALPLEVRTSGAADGDLRRPRAPRSTTATPAATIRPPGCAASARWTTRTCPSW